MPALPPTHASHALTHTRTWGSRSQVWMETLLLLLVLLPVGLASSSPPPPLPQVRWFSSKMAETVAMARAHRRALTGVIPCCSGPGVALNGR